MQRLRDLLSAQTKPFDDEHDEEAPDSLDEITPEEDDQLDDLLDEMEERIREPEVLPPLNTTLLAHAGANKISRADLAMLKVPDATNTFQPIHHAKLIDELESALAFRHISIMRDDYAVSTDGMKLFGLLELNAEYEGVRFAIGLRNANDKSMRLGMVAGYRVFVCDNMMLSGDFKPLLAKHSKHFDLVESISIAVDRIQRGFEPLRNAIEFKRNYRLDSNEARSIIYSAFMSNKFPLKLMKSVHREYFERPSHKEFEQPTMWSLENSFTTTFKELAPVRQYEMTARLAKFLQPYAGTA
jgi:hypothetical protein